MIRLFVALCATTLLGSYACLNQPSESPDGRFACQDTDDCASGFDCINGLCCRPGNEAACAPNGGADEPDSGAPNSGTVDEPDAGMPPRDGGVIPTGALT